MRGRYTRKDKKQGNIKNKTRRRKMQVNNMLAVNNIIKKNTVAIKRYNRQAGGGPWEWLNEVETSIYNSEHFITALVIYDYGWKKILQNVPSWYEFLKNILDAIQHKFKSMKDI